MNTPPLHIDAWVERYCAPDDPDDTLIEMELGQARQWAWQLREMRENYYDLERVAQAAIGKLNREIKELRERLAEEAQGSLFDE